MDDPFSKVGGPPPKQVASDPFYPLTARSVERRKAHRIRSALIVGAVVGAGVIAINVVSGIGTWATTTSTPVVCSVQGGIMSSSKSHAGGNQWQSDPIIPLTADRRATDLHHLTMV